MRALGPSAISALNATQIAGLSTLQIGALGATQVQNLSNNQLEALSNTQFAALSSAAFAGLAPEQTERTFRHPHQRASTRRQIKGLAATVVSALTNDQISASPPPDCRLHHLPGQRSYS
ncbi:MAG: hypothetical protein IPO30_16250 [Hyphomonadaceae bacterium]|nr:hypothetical protein [Hyphomonadaceae bacterium]